MILKQRIIAGTMVGLVLCLVVCGCLFYPIMPAIDWHIHGVVLDTTRKPIPDALVHTAAVGRVYGFHRLFSLAPERRDVNAKTDSFGAFDLTFNSSICALSVQKPGYADYKKLFRISEAQREPTNIQVAIVLQPSK